MDAPAVNRGMFISHFLLGLEAFGVLRLPFFQSLTSPNGRPSQVLSHPAVICVRAKPWTERRLGIPALEGEGIRTNNVRTIHRPHNMSKRAVLQVCSRGENLRRAVEAKFCSPSISTGGSCERCRSSGRRSRTSK